MLLRNKAEYNLCNGSRGVIIDFILPGSIQYSDYERTAPPKKVFNKYDEMEEQENEVVTFYDPKKYLPVVKFRPIKSRVNGKTVYTERKPIVIDQEKWEIYDGKMIEASRRQIPLKLAFAMTMHKSQGMSIDSLRVDLKNTFEYGQAYGKIKL